MRSFACILALLLSLGIIHLAWAAPPPYAVSYQGILVDDYGDPVPDDAYDINFEIFSEETGGILLWGEEFEVEVTNGIFSVLLGEGSNPIDPAMFDGYAAWMQVSVRELSVIFPRQKLAYVVYALLAIDSEHADEADSADDLDCTNCVQSSEISPGAVTSSRLGTDAVTSDKIADGAVTTDKIAEDAVTGGKIANGAVGSPQIVDGAVVSSKISSNAITSDKIASGAVTSAKLGAGAVTSDKIGSGAVTGSKIASDAVTSSKIADGAVGSPQIVDGAVVSSKISANAIISDKIASNSVTSSKVAFNYAGSTSEGGAASDLVCSGCVGSTDLASDAVNEDQIGWPLIFSDSLDNGGLISAENSANGSSGNYPAGLSGASSGSPGAYKVIGVMGSTPPLGGNTAHALLPTGSLGVAGVSQAGKGVVGVSDTGYGMYGMSSGYLGVYGRSEGDDWDDSGVKGVSTTGGTGVYGSSSTGFGVFGISGSGMGVSGTTSAAGASGVRGYTYTDYAYGVSGRGYNNATAGYFEAASGYGLVALTDGTTLNATAVKAENTGGGIALWTTTDSSDASAVFSNNGDGELIKGFGSDGGNHEFAVNNDGSIWSESWISADGDINSDGRIYTGSSPPTVVYNGNNYSTNIGDLGSSDDVLIDDDLIVGSDAFIDGEIYGGKGGMATLIEFEGAFRTFHVDEATQDMITDRGSGRLAYGEATVFLDAVYADSIRVDESHPLIVQLTPTDDCNGLYVAATTGNSFTVRELGDGTSDASFDWEVAAYRKGGMEGRMPELTTALTPAATD